MAFMPSIGTASLATAFVATPSRAKEPICPGYGAAAHLRLKFIDPCSQLAWGAMAAPGSTAVRLFSWPACHQQPS
jgi:hypothetical protein